MSNLTIVFFIISIWSWFNYYKLSKGKEARFYTWSLYRKYDPTIFALSARGKKIFKYFWLLVASISTVIVVYSLFPTTVFA